MLLDFPSTDRDQPVSGDLGALSRFWGLAACSHQAQREEERKPKGILKKTGDRVEKRRFYKTGVANWRSRLGTHTKSEYLAFVWAKKYFANIFFKNTLLLK